MPALRPVLPADAANGATLSDDRCRAYAAFFETLTPETLPGLDALVTEDVLFRDPFNDTRGAAAMRRIFTRMFAEIGDPRFHVSDFAIGGDTAFLRWRFTGRSRNRGAGAITIEGVSEIVFAGDGRVRAHIDHWDAASQVYERIAILGWVIRKVRRKLAG